MDRLTPQISSAAYSGVEVYEMEVNGVAVMRRQADSWLNASQILKVAGINKRKPTKVLKNEIFVGEHEKVQGGYGKYQGTWIKFEKGVEFCRSYGVEHLLRPLLTYDMGPDGGVAGRGGMETPTKPVNTPGRKRCLIEDPSWTLLCERCYRLFRRQQDLDRHYQSIHTQEQNFECQECGRKFSSKEKLSQHEQLCYFLYALSEPLAALVGETMLPKTQVYKRIWDHIRALNLQDPADPRQVLCDDKMYAVFKKDKMHMFTIDKNMWKHIYQEAGQPVERARRLPVEDHSPPDTAHFASMNGKLVPQPQTKTANKHSQSHHGHGQDKSLGESGNNKPDIKRKHTDDDADRSDCPRQHRRVDPGQPIEQEHIMMGLIYKPIKESLRSLQNASKEKVAHHKERAAVLKHELIVIGKFIDSLVQDDEDISYLRTKFWRYVSIWWPEQPPPGPRALEKMSYKLIAQAKEGGACSLKGEAAEA